MKWEILKGSEKDFEGAPAWATECVWNDKGEGSFSYWLNPETKTIFNTNWHNGPTCWNEEYGHRNYIRAERRPITEPDVNQQLTTEWSGEGLPPVGVECEMLWDKEWVKCVIKAYGDEQFIFKAQGHREWAGHINNFEFRPIRSAEDVARHNALYALESLNIDSDVTVSIYDAIAAGKIPGVKLE